MCDVAHRLLGGSFDMIIRTSYHYDVHQGGKVLRGLLGYVQ